MAFIGLGICRAGDRPHTEMVFELIHAVYNHPLIRTICGS
ncbi:hypothetical protein FHT91_002676 [Rhizobium sp. BK347]|nr:hypothetical protein [Rhizobium sp. BK252]MBB3402440.1 hypothetical protein [Rhizobium sp. BK289]MBB3415016.1 hypothetical protein [Rhizobium sp. BK284]MBB3482905.1 hypothetical protein [Rhizobium sp. BK347]